MSAANDRTSPRRVARAAARRLRPVAGAREARRVLGTGLLSPWYLELQTGRRFATPVQAAADWLADGWRLGRLPNPLSDVSGLALDRVRADLLSGDARLWPLRPIVDDVELVRAAPAAADHPGGPAGHVLAAGQAGTLATTVEGLRWSSFVGRRRRQGRAARTILASGLFDAAHYRLQAGPVAGDDLAALWHFVEVGEPAGLSPHPLYESGWYHDPDVRTLEPFAAFVSGGQTAGAAGPHFDAARHLVDHPEASDHRGGPLGHFLETASPDALTPAADGVTSVPLRTALAAVREAAETYGRQQRQAGLVQAPRHARWRLELDLAVADASAPDDAVAVVADTRAWDVDDATAAARLSEQTHERWRLVLGVESEDDLPAHVRALADSEPRVRLVELGVADRVTALATMATAFDLPWVAFWHPGEAWHRAALTRLLAASSGHQGARGAVVQGRRDETWVLDPDPGSDPLWSEPRSLSGTLVRRDLLLEHPLDPAAADHWGWEWLVRVSPDLAFAPFVASRGDVLPGTWPSDRPVGVTSTHEHVVRARHLLDWDALTAAIPARRSGRTSALVPTFHDWRLTRDAVDAVLAGSEGHDVQVVVLDNGSGPAVSSVLRACWAHDERVVVERVPRNTNFSTGSNLAFARSNGERVVFLNNDTEVEPGWLDPLLPHLDDEQVAGVQPLLLYGDGSVQTAGTVFLGGPAIPAHFLASHPTSDLDGVRSRHFAAVTAACLAMRAATVADLRGFDPEFANGMEDVDLCLRAGLDGRHRFVVEPRSVVVHHESRTPGRFASSESNRLRYLDRWLGAMPPSDAWRYAEAGFEMTGYRAQPAHRLSRLRTGGQPLLARRPALVEDGPGEGLPRLRWAVRGDGADDLVEALRSWGQDAFGDRSETHERPDADYLDDVAVTLPGSTATSPQPGATNVAVTSAVHAPGHDVVLATADARTMLAAVLDARGVEHDLG